MPGIPGLEHVEGFAPPHFADDVAIGAKAQRRADQIGYGDAAGHRRVPDRVRSATTSGAAY